MTCPSARLPPVNPTLHVPTLPIHKGIVALNAPHNKVTPKLEHNLNFNISHDGALVLVASTERQGERGETCQVGVDVMEVALRSSDTLSSLVESTGDQVGPVSNDPVLRLTEIPADTLKTLIS